jgi:hypothetical protein
MIRLSYRQSIMKMRNLHSYVQFATQPYRDFQMQAGITQPIAVEIVVLNLILIPEEENIRRESKLTVPDRNEETLVTTINQCLRIR